MRDTEQIEAHAELASGYATGCSRSGSYGPEETIALRRFEARSRDMCERSFDHIIP